MVSLENKGRYTICYIIKKKHEMLYLHTWIFINDTTDRHVFSVVPFLPELSEYKFQFNCSSDATKLTINYARFWNFQIMLDSAKNFD